MRKIFYASIFTLATPASAMCFDSHWFEQQQLQNQFNNLQYDIDRLASQPPQIIVVPVPQPVQPVYRAPLRPGYSLGGYCYNLDLC